jgi:hypothetical protein
MSLYVFKQHRPDGMTVYGVMSRTTGASVRLPNGKMFTEHRAEAVAFAKGRAKRARAREKRKWGGTYGGGPLGM